MRVGILGLGLIGGSLARAYAKAGHRVFAQDQDASILEFAQLAGAVEAPLNQETIPQCDLILLAIYTGGCIAWLEEKGLYASGAAFELYAIDNRDTSLEEEFLTEIQIPVSAASSRASKP